MKVEEGGISFEDYLTNKADEFMSLVKKYSV